MEYASLLRQHIGQIIALSDTAFDIVLGYFSGIQLPKKKYLIKAGQKVTAEYFVIQGCLKSAVYDDLGKEYIIQFAQENWWTSDYAAYVGRTLAETDIQAVEDCFVLELTRENRQRMCNEVPEMHIFFENKAFGGYVASQKRVLSLLRNSAKEKYNLLLDQHPELFQRLPHKIIAQYLGVSRETLSRLKKK